MRHPELPADHRDRHGVGELVHEVDLVLAAHSVDQVGGGAHHVGPHRFGLLEVTRGQPPQSVVRGRVHSDEAAATRTTTRTSTCATARSGACTTARPGACATARPGAESADADPRVVHQIPDLPVGADDVGAVRGAEDRRRAQLRVQRVGVGAVGVVENPGEQARLAARRVLGHARPPRAGSSVHARSVGEWPVRTIMGPSVGTTGSGKSACNTCRDSGCATLR